MTSLRLGTTSYILPAGLADNARYLRDYAQDMELVLFDLPDGQCNYPDAAEAAALRAVGEQGLSYTVHLPLDLRLWADGSATHPSLAQARRVIELTGGLQPWAYVLHLDGRELLAAQRTGQATAAMAVAWQAQAARALEFAADWAGEPERLAVENLEGYPLDFILPVLERVPVSRCVDIGHLWRDGHDPLPYLRAALPRLRVVHLHGLNAEGRDHQSLVHQPREQLAPVLALLREAEYRGVLTLEVFGEADFHSSLAALAAAAQPEIP
ncbi:MAG: sugar phosphate isomerase/epimerase [Anaerolineales bacterium]|nr:sugar phosphate isomerase/epimerase [Anaerolineales bacterium]